MCVGQCQKHEGGGEVVRDKACLCVHAHMCHWQFAARWKLICQGGCILFTDHVFCCGILVGSFQDVAIMLTSSPSRHTPLQCCNNTHHTPSLLPDFFFGPGCCAVPPNCFGSNNNVCNWGSNGFSAGWFVCIFVSRWWKASQIRTMCQCCLGAECSTMFLQTQPPSITLCPGSQWGGWLRILQGPSAGPGKTQPDPPHLLQYGKPMVCGFCLGYIQATWSSCLGVVRTYIWITRMSGRGEL